MSGPAARIERKIGFQTRSLEPSNDDQALREARQRTIEGTDLVFDREWISLPERDGQPMPDPFTPADRSEIFRLAFVECQLHTQAETGDPRLRGDAEGYEGILTPCSDAVRGEMRRHLVDQLALALQSECDAIVFPEFALPPIDIEPVFLNRTDTAQADFDPFYPPHQALVDEQFELAAAAMLDEACTKAGRDPSEAPFIFYGSMHCRQSRYNIGVVSPGRPFEGGYIVQSERTNPFSNASPPSSRSDTPRPPAVTRQGPIAHKKRFPARRRREAARVNPGVGFRLYPSKLGMIAVLICSDAIDLNQFWYIVRYNQTADLSGNRDRIGLVIVPAYTQSDLLYTTCRDLSALANTTVFVGNASGKYPTRNDLRPANMPDPQIYHSGKERGELKRGAGFRYEEIGDSILRYSFPSIPLV